MSANHVAVKWNANKRRYDLVVAAGVLSYLALFLLLGALLRAGDPVVLTLRGLGSAAYLLFHVVLCIGPLARLEPRLTPLLYNRRHLGVTTFLLGLAHGGVAVGYYHGFGVVSPLASLLTSNTQYRSLSGFPFEILGLGALLLLFLLAATSHDFWQHALGANFWKAMHMLAYPAYALLVGHVALGLLQSDRSALLAALVVAGAAVVVGLHLVVAVREARRVTPTKPVEGTWLDVGCVDDIPDSRALTVCVPGHERVAVFRYDGRVSAVSNVCAHQRGPLGEGQVIDGCVTCPWHGWEYRPDDGQAPPPFTEKVPTYRVKVEGRRVLLDVVPLPAGTPVEPARITEKHDG